MNRNLIVIALLLLLPGGSILAQEDKTLRDSTIMIQDSVIYNSIDQGAEGNIRDSTKYQNFEKITERSKFGRALHRILFRRLEKEARPRLPVTQVIEGRNHRIGQGRIIRNIRILTFDPFGFNIRDTSLHYNRVVFNAGNYLHAKTNAPVIKNLLLFGENERYDSTLVIESERLIRSQKYIRDVYLEITPVRRDSVDIELRVLDVWSLLPSAMRNSTFTGFGIKDLNFAGTGNTLELNTRFRRDMKGNVTKVNYLMPNIRNTYTSLNIQYLFSPDRKLTDILEFDDYFFSPVSSNPLYVFSDNKNIIRSIELNRPFYSPFTRFAGGAFLGQIITTQTYINFDSLQFISAKTNIADLWFGRSWQIFKENRNDRISSLVLSGRFVNTHSPVRPQEAIGAGLFNTHKYYFGALSVTSRKYFRDRYIFNYGKTEDVPAGKVAGITIGREYLQHSRLYVGINAGSGTYYGFGYLSMHLSYGTFIDPTGFKQGLLTGRITYFTRLLTIGDWKLRQFVRPSFAFGINKSPADNQPIRIGIKGFETIESMAPNITVVSLQTQSYAPWNLAGFHFGPFLFTHIGILGQEPLGYRGRIYSLLGLGVLIKNDYLMFNTFQVSFSFYPYIPVDRYNLIRTNAYKTTDYGFRDFEVSKPGIVE
ncbi:MAG: hypothetical protein ACM3UT_09280 [Chloroflexota bacterium]